MSLKLFRATVWAHSIGPNPEDPRDSGWNPLWLALFASVWMASIGNLALWRALMALPDVSGPRGVLFGIGFGVMIGCALMALLSVFAWRWTLKPLVVVLLLATAASTHFMLLYGIVIDGTMIANVLQTDVRETRDLLNLRLLLILVLLGVLPAVLLARMRLQPLRLTAQAWRNLLALLVSAALLVAVVFASFQDFSALMRNHKQLRFMINPLNSVYALAREAIGERARKNRPMLAAGEDARLGSRAPSDRPPLLLLVVGETARSMNFSLNGYARPTNPELAKLDVLSFRNARSCGTSTAASLPCMFSHLGREGYESRSNDYENLMDVLQRAGLAVLWIDNQSGCKGLCDRIPNLGPAQIRVPELCDGNECLDEVMLRGLDARIAALDPQRRARGVVVVLHQMGSHGPAYYKRSPAALKKFQPECTTNVLQQCDRQQVVNAYDNSIVYTDHVLAQAVQWLGRQGAYHGALFYMSDHGESLGENNLYLHGLPYAIAPDYQKVVPFITWLSPGAQRWSHVDTNCLRQRLDQPVSHDHLFHSVLGLMNVQTSLYNRGLDVYAPCATAATTR